MFLNESFDMGMPLFGQTRLSTPTRHSSSYTRYRMDEEGVEEVSLAAITVQHYLDNSGREAFVGWERALRFSVDVVN